ncbi:MAG: GAF domain-containing protein [Candidatus Kariarchaeaceae archaeon]|jgi:GAF domain-containing protein
MVRKEERYTLLNTHIQKILKEKNDRDTTLQAISKVLREEVHYFDWVGFYIVDPDKPQELYLGPYEGAKTDHVRIPFGRGICGQVAESQNTYVIQDVSEEDNYLSCSSDVQSEIVVPIFRESGEFIAELDIDSDTIAPFTDEDTVFLEKVAGDLSHLFKESKQV